MNNASVLGWRAQEGQAHYAAAKAGVMALTRCAAVEAAEAGEDFARHGRLARAFVITSYSIHYTKLYDVHGTVETFAIARQAAPSSPRTW